MKDFYTYDRNGKLIVDIYGLLHDPDFQKQIKAAVALSELNQNKNNPYPHD